MRPSTTPFNRVMPKSVIEPEERRRDGDLPQAGDIRRLTNTYADNAILDDRTSPVLMAIECHKLGDGEPAAWTEAMFRSGSVFDFLGEETKS